MIKAIIGTFAGLMIYVLSVQAVFAKEIVDCDKVKNCPMHAMVLRGIKK